MQTLVPWSALCDSASLRRFVGIDLDCEPVLDATTMLKFRRLLNDNKLGEALIAWVGRELQARGIKVNTGIIVDATVIGAPSPTKNADKARDPEMHQTKKGQQWHFGMKLHIGVDSQTGLTHSAVVTAANIHDKHPLPNLLHGNAQRVYGDSAYASQKELIASKAPEAKDFTNQRTRRNGAVDEVQRAKNRNKSRIRAQVEHVIGGASGCGALLRYAIAACTRMPPGRSQHWRWPIFTSAGNDCRHRCARKSLMGVERPTKLP